jgi:aminomuconate-semialdehyde/2-hydroxymuconate-6-semialdehyde dehydrogenase
MGLVCYNRLQNRPRLAEDPTMNPLRNFLDGRHVEPASGQTIEKIDPATGRAAGLIPDSDDRDIDQAVAAARRAFPRWSRTSPAERCRLLLAIADGIENRLERLALAECTDTGKPLRLARAVDIPRAAANFRFFATAVLHQHSETYRTDNLALNYTLRQPRGVAGLISPWNLPIYLLTWKIAPALATGNTVVAKPPELAPTTAHLLTEICQEAGLPPGVLNIVHGLGSKAGAALVAHPDVPTISFTGGTVTGREIARQAASQFKRLSLELGGKNPNIVFADADLDKALPTSVRSSFENQGEICLCGSRIFVEQSLYPAFVERLTAAAKALVVGDPLEPGTQMGALISRPHRDKVLQAIARAREEGGRILCGGGPPDQLPARCREGFFVAPTVITDLDAQCKTNQEEIFGPVVTVTPFQSEEEVVRLANATPYGLSASVWTRDLTRASRLAEQIEAGTVWLNCWLVRDLRVPFGGWKQSGVGREGGDEALRFFTEAKTVCLESSLPAPKP